jgi:type VI secretion system ImpM family protein
MQCGLYGKVPAKRDFIAIGAPREFLNAWEPWLQAAISASRTTLGEAWQPAFLTAPIWRFWLGADICGRSVIGAFMSSLDGVGRYFPLTLFACADDGAAIPPPEYGAQDGWFDTVETFLMSTLDQGAQFETMTAQLGALPPPVQRVQDLLGLKGQESGGSRESPGKDVISETAPPGKPVAENARQEDDLQAEEPTDEAHPGEVSAGQAGGEAPAVEAPAGKVPAGSGCSANGVWALQAGGQGFGELFSSIRLRDYARIYAGSTFWWTIGGEGIAPVALSGKGMPDPFLFSSMLTGRFAADHPA